MVPALRPSHLVPHGYHGRGMPYRMQSIFPDRSYDTRPTAGASIRRAGQQHEIRGAVLEPSMPSSRGSFQPEVRHR